MATHFINFSRTLYLHFLHSIYKVNGQTDIFVHFHTFDAGFSSEKTECFPEKKKKAITKIENLQGYQVRHRHEISYA